MHIFKVEENNYLKRCQKKIIFKRLRSKNKIKFKKKRENPVEVLNAFFFF